MFRVYNVRYAVQLRAWPGITMTQTLDGFYSIRLHNITMRRIVLPLVTVLNISDTPSTPVTPPCDSSVTLTWDDGLQYVFVGHLRYSHNNDGAALVLPAAARPARHLNVLGWNTQHSPVGQSAVGVGVLGEGGAVLLTRKNDAINKLIRTRQCVWKSCVSTK